MKKVIYSLLAGAMVLASCSDFTDIQPKGKNLLSSDDELELLLNNEYEWSDYDMNNLGGEILYTYNDVSALMNVPAKSRRTYLWGFFDSEEDIQAVERLTTSDNFYSTLYGLVGTVCNPILQQVGTASGDFDKLKQITAEAYALRAYCHFLLLQKFAKAYNSATATEDPAIVYLTEDCDIQTPQPKKTVKEVYDLCLQDINAAIELNAVPVQAASTSRLNKAATYAIKAHICMGMQNYTEAEAAATTALSIQGTLHDYYADAAVAYDYNHAPYYYTALDCRDSEETYLSICNSSFLDFVSPECFAEVENTYATLHLMYYINNMYRGISSIMPSYAIYEDYGSLYSLPGWMCTYSVMLGNSWNASGLTVANMYLLIAEAELRAGNIDAAMANLDVLRASRIMDSAYEPLLGKVTTKTEAIAKIKATSLGENMWGPWNFIERKRWNVEDDWKTTITHTIGGQVRTLTPESNLWVFPFPKAVRENNPYLTSNRNK